MMGEKRLSSKHTHTKEDKSNSSQDFFLCHCHESQVSCESVMFMNRVQQESPKNSIFMTYKTVQVSQLKIPFLSTTIKSELGPKCISDDEKLRVDEKPKVHLIHININ